MWSLVRCQLALWGSYGNCWITDKLFVIHLISLSFGLLNLHVTFIVGLQLHFADSHSTMSTPSTKDLLAPW